MYRLKDLSLKGTVIFLCLLMLSCSSADNKVTEIKDGTETEVNLQQVASSYDYTVVYGWATWCMPCVKTIKQKLPAFRQRLNTYNEDIGLIAVCADGSITETYEKMNSFMQENNIPSYFIKTSTLQLHDRFALNTFFAEAFEHYESSSSVPIVFLVNKGGEVLSDNPWLIASEGVLERVIDSVRRGR